jgi:CubicO group peptidase (beta-lactamase class C family)
VVEPADHKHEQHDAEDKRHGVEGSGQAAKVKHTCRAESTRRVPAAVTVTRSDKVLSLHGYGVDAAGTPVTRQSLFRIASLSKSTTALAVMQLVDTGLLRLDDPVQQHLPEFQLADPRAGHVTVRQL